ncbi:hypothetical protein C8J56DRAFT_1053296 [Mycena floridula]|nr:hypothetical protein C8J56DRAFT_1053296 [Mycena floridula]
MRRPGGHWGASEFTQREHDGTEEEGQKYLTLLGFDRWIYWNGVNSYLQHQNVHQIPAQCAPMCLQGELSLEQLYHHLQRCIRAFVSPKPYAQMSSTGQCLNELKICNGKAGFRFEDAGRWYLECTNSEYHDCPDGFLTLPLYKLLILELKKIREQIVNAGGDWGIYLTAEGEEEFDAREDAGARYLEMIGIHRFLHHRQVGLHCPKNDDGSHYWESLLFIYVSIPTDCYIVQD